MSVGVSARICRVIGRVAGACLAMLVSTALAAPPSSITVVLDDSYPPYLFRDQAGRLQGILRDAWALWEARTGIKVNLIGMDWALAQQHLQSGQADVIDSMFETPQRRLTYEFGPAYVDIAVPIFFHESISGITNAESLKGFTIGVKEGDACLDYLSSQGLQSFRKYPSYEAVIDAAAVGEVRVFCEDQPPASYFLIRKQLDKQFRRAGPLFTGQFHRAVRKGDVATLQLVEEGFKRISPAEWREIEARWLGAPIEGVGSHPLWRYGGYGLTAIALLALALGVWTLSLRRRVQSRTQALSASLQQLSAAKRDADQALARFEATLEAIPDLLFELDLDGRYLDYRSARDDLLAAERETLIGRKVPDVLPAEAADLVMQALHEAADRGTSHGIQIRLMLPDGWHWFELSVARKRAMAGERDHFIMLSRDISDRKRAEDELARHGSELEMIVHERSRQLVEARDASERASRAKSEFLSRMSHELRTPMNAILGFSQLLEMDPATAPKARDFVNEILRAGQHLLHLINDVLDLEQVESGRLSLSPEVIDLAALGAEMVSLMQPLAHKQAVTLHLGLHEALAVQADAVRLKQVVLNLLSNAIKYNRVGGQVWLEASAPCADRVRITVRDTGPGIAAQHLPQLFQPFNRLGAEAGPIEGTGIGLSLCRRLAELMGGEVGVDSTEGQGSTFWLALPRAPWPDGATDDTAQPGAALAAMAAIGPTQQGQRPSPRQAVMLYIEDNPANLTLMAQIAARHIGVLLISAPTGQLGLALARVHQPDLILLDIHLPDTDGYALLDELRADPALRGVPVIAVTANAMPMDVQRIRQAGFDGQVAKPIQVTQMDLLIHEQLGTTLV
jgi:two-component system sensor histidine kinase/response regulator